MNEGAAAREDLGEAIARRQDEAEDDEGEEPRAFAQGRPADEVIDEPPGDQRADGEPTESALLPLLDSTATALTVTP